MNKASNIEVVRLKLQIKELQAKLPVWELNDGRFPAEGVYTILRGVCEHGEFHTIGFFDGESGWTGELGEDLSDYNITHWMRIPPLNE